MGPMMDRQAASASGVDGLVIDWLVSGEGKGVGLAMCRLRASQMHGYLDGRAHRSWHGGKVNLWAGERWMDR